MRNKINIGEYQHLYLRGNDGKELFIDKNDYHRFLNLLKYCNKLNGEPFSVLLRRKKEIIDKELSSIKEDLNEIIISTLMPNHFHILLRCLRDGSASKHMQKLLGSFSMYLNKKYKKRGYKFEMKYQNRKITNEHDLLNVIDYIYHNPAKILDPKYKHSDLITGNYKLSDEQKDFLKKYPYTYKGPTFEEYKNRYNLPY